MLAGKLNEDITLFHSVAISYKSLQSANAPVSIEELAELENSTSDLKDIPYVEEQK